MTSTTTEPARLRPQPPASTGPHTRTEQRATLAVVCATTAMLMLDIAVVNTALPHMARSLHATLSGLQWVVDAYTLALATVVLSAGAWADRRGRRHVFLLGLALFTVASAACAAAPGIVVLDVARGAQGLGAAVLFACSLALLAEAFPAPGERAKALGAYGATIGGSFAVGPLLGGVMTSTLGWRAIFLVNVPLGVVTAAATRRWVRESRDGAPRGADVPGQLLACAGLGALVLGLLRVTVDGWDGRVPLAAFAVAVVSLAAFLLVERASREPMLPLDLFANRAFTGAQLAAFAISASMFSVFLYTTIYLQAVLHLSPVHAGLVYLPGTVVMFVVAGATSAFVERVPVALTLGVSLLVVAAGLLMMTHAGTHSSALSLVPGFVVACIGAGVFNPVMSGLVLGEAEASQSGLAAGVNDAFRQTGIALGVAALGALFPAPSVLAGGSADAFVTGLHRALLVSAVVAAVGAVSCWMTLRRR
jgi:EmrB/QacA subfamily drug resistance transporter